MSESKKTEQELLDEWLGNVTYDELPDGVPEVEYEFDDD
jgi:hypothetical protein